MNIATPATTSRDRRLERAPVSPPNVHRVLLAAIGPVPVTLVGLSTFGWLTFRELVTVIAPPTLGLLGLVITTNRAARYVVIDAITAGLVATLLYDLLRWTFIFTGWMQGDPIPGLGTSLGLEPGWIYGYLWRFLGNGSGLAITFYAARAKGLRAGIAYGLAICTGLLAVLAFAPYGQDALFPLRLSTVVAAVSGHIVYGATLGLFAQHVRPDD